MKLTIVKNEVTRECTGTGTIIAGILASSKVKAITKCFEEVYGLRVELKNDGWEEFLVRRVLVKLFGTESNLRRLDADMKSGKIEAIIKGMERA